MNGASVSRTMRGAPGDCANIRRTRFEVFSFEENVITPGAPTVNLCQTTHWGDARTSDADVQVREVVQQALPKLGRIREAMYVNLWDAHLAWRMEWVAGTCFMVRRYFG